LLDSVEAKLASIVSFEAADDPCIERLDVQCETRLKVD